MALLTWATGILRNLMYRKWHHNNKLSSQLTGLALPSTHMDQLSMHYGLFVSTCSTMLWNSLNLTRATPRWWEIVIQLVFAMLRWVCSYYVSSCYFWRFRMCPKLYFGLKSGVGVRVTSCTNAGKVFLFDNFLCLQFV